MQVVTLKVDKFQKRVRIWCFFFADLKNAALTLQNFNEINICSLLKVLYPSGYKGVKKTHTSMSQT